MIELKNISFSYPRQEVLIDLDLSLSENKINCLLGPSGCGKTTILNLLAKTKFPTSGTISGLPREISYIFQETRILPWKTVFQNVIFPLKGILPDKEISVSAERFLKHVNLWDYRDAFPDELSGGMKQRVSIARAFAYPSSLILMDEAFQGLDPILKDRLLLDFIKSWEDEPRTVVFVTHDLDEALLLGQQIIILPKAPITKAEIIQIDQKPGADRTNQEFLEKEIRAAYSK